MEQGVYGGCLLSPFYPILDAVNTTNANQLSGPELLPELSIKQAPGSKIKK